MSDGAIVLLMLVVICAVGGGVAVGNAILAPQLRALTDIANKQAEHMQQQARTIAEPEQYIADHSDATAEELGYDGKG